MITALTQKRSGNATTVTAVSDLAGAVIYHWYLDGVYLGCGRSSDREFFLAAGEQAHIDVIDTIDPDFDGKANAPNIPAARKRLRWTAAIDPTAGAWRVEEKVDGGTWRTIAKMSARTGQWNYEYITRRLTDLANYVWRVVPVDEAGNDRTAVILDAAKIVRIPDAPAFTASYSAATNRVTIQ